MYRKKLVSWLQTVENINAKLLLFFMGKLNNLDNNDLKDVDKVFPEILVEIDGTDDKIIKQFKAELMKELEKVNASKSSDFIFIYLGKKLKDQTFNQDISTDVNYSLLDHELKTDDLYRLFYLSYYSSEQIDNKECLRDILSSYSVFFARQYQLRELALCIMIATSYKEFFPDIFYKDSWDFLVDNQTKEGYFGFSDPFVTVVKTDREKILDSFYCYYALSKLEEL